MVKADQIIQKYALEPLDQEGGFFRQIWRSPVRVENSALGEAYPARGDHPLGTVIHFLLTEDSFSAMHRLPTPEHWFFHLGDACEMLLLHADGLSESVRIGADVASGEKIHVVTPANAWQGTRLVAGGSHGFMFGSCVMMPGFEWADFELGTRQALIDQYPAAEEAICARTRKYGAKGAL